MAATPAVAGTAEGRPLELGKLVTATAVCCRGLLAAGAAVNPGRGAGGWSLASSPAGPIWYLQCLMPSLRLRGPLKTVTNRLTPVN